MATHEVTTWADGFGLWHARVTVPRGQEASAEEIAREAILKELSMREGPKFDPDSVTLVLGDRVKTTFEFREQDIYDEETS